MIKFLSEIGISVPHIAGFLAALFLSYCGANQIVRKLYEVVFDKLIKGGRDGASLTDEQLAERRKQFSADLDLDFGRIIGSAERAFYIYAVMSSQAGYAAQFGIVTTWVILKAFFGWIDRPDGLAERAKDEDTEKRKEDAHRKLVMYYLYIFGNGMSLAAGIALGHVGYAISKLVSALIGHF